MENHPAGRSRGCLRRFSARGTSLILLGPMGAQLLFLEFNEINLESVRYYADRRVLPNRHRLIENNGWATTTSEQQYQDIEPWIQWVSAHSGRSLEEHRVFRLGDIVQHELPQIWESLEARGLRVGA